MKQVKQWIFPKFFNPFLRNSSSKRGQTDSELFPINTEVKDSVELHILSFNLPVLFQVSMKSIIFLLLKNWNFLDDNLEIMSAGKTSNDEPDF